MRRGSIRLSSLSISSVITLSLSLPPSASVSPPLSLALTCRNFELFLVVPTSSLSRQSNPKFLSLYFPVVPSLSITLSLVRTLSPPLFHLRQGTSSISLPPLLLSLLSQLQVDCEGWGSSIRCGGRHHRSSRWVSRR
jgi:hypothetical protein